MIPTSNAQAFAAAYGASLLREQAWRERAEMAEQECRDRECTEQDVRARLADAENALAKVKALTDVAAKQPSSQQWVHVVAIRTALDGNR